MPQLVIGPVHVLYICPRSPHLLQYDAFDRHFFVICAADISKIDTNLSS